MKKILGAVSVLAICLTSNAQFIRGSIRKGTLKDKIDIVFRPDFSTVSADRPEYVDILQFSIAIPASLGDDVTATAVGVNAFSNMGTLQQGPTNIYTEPNSPNKQMRVFTWVYANPALATQSWSAGVDFTGIEVTFNKAAAANQVKMLDLAKVNGGGGIGSYFTVVTNVHGDVADYSDLFFSLPGENKKEKYETSGDQYVQMFPNVSNEPDGGQGRDFSVFPNPAGNVIQISHEKAAVGSLIQVFDVNGALVTSKKVSQNDILTTLNISRLKAASYMLVYMNGTEKRTTSFVKVLSE